MEKRWMRHAAAAAAVSAMLSLAAPARASAWTPRSPETGFLKAAWQWLTEIWSAPEGAGQPVRDLSKEGGGIDPAGGRSQPPPPDQTQSDGGNSIDPSG